MDETPFLEFNLLEIKDSLVPELKKFQNTNFDLETILNTASELKYTNLIKQYLVQQMSSPSDAFVKIILAKYMRGRRPKTLLPSSEML